jgi:hypothetical protein
MRPPKVKQGSHSKLDDLYVSKVVQHALTLEVTDSWL